MSDATVKTAFFPTASVLRRIALNQMRARLEAGHRVVIGTKEAIEDGRVLADIGGRQLIFKRRATREDFLASAPGAIDGSTIDRAPFYYELELAPATPESQPTRGIL